MKLKSEIGKMQSVENESGEKQSVKTRFKCKNWNSGGGCGMLCSIDYNITVDLMVHWFTHISLP